MASGISCCFLIVSPAARQTCNILPFFAKRAGFDVAFRAIFGSLASERSVFNPSCQARQTKTPVARRKKSPRRLISAPAWQAHNCQETSLFPPIDLALARAFAALWIMSSSVLRLAVLVAMPRDILILSFRLFISKRVSTSFF